MTDNKEKLLSPDEFKNEVYKNVGTLEGLDEASVNKSLATKNTGCFGILLMPVLKPFVKNVTKKARKELKIKELSFKADEILAQKEVQDLLCEKLDATVNLPIDAAYKITPILYKLALENEENVPFNSMLFAIICRKVTTGGVHNYCGPELKTFNQA